MVNANFTRLIQMIMKALEDERAAAAFYGQMANLSPDREAKNAFLEARRDERQHAAEIRRILRQLNGFEPPGNVSKVPVPTNFLDGVRKAIEGEEMAISDYTNIINMIGIESLRETFREIREDEIRHLARFKTLL